MTAHSCQRRSGPRRFDRGAHGPTRAKAASQRLLVVSIVLPLCGAGVRLEAQDYPHIAADFHHRYVEVPLDHRDPALGTFTLYYELSSNFTFDRPTVFYIVDSQQYAHGADRTARDYGLSDSLNLVLIEYRGRTHSPIDMRNPDGSVDWRRAYRLLASHQAVEDIEAVRRDLFSEAPDTRIYLYGRSGGAYLIHEYLSKYPTHATRAFTRTAPNPLIMHRQGNPESTYFSNSLDAIDSSLRTKLRAVLDRETVAPRDLLWLLLQLPYNDPNAPQIQARIINELYQRDTTTYHEYHAEPRYDLAGLLRSPVLERQMGVGMFLRPLECDGPYLLGPEPEYVDPVYTTFRYVSAPFISLIEDEGLPGPEYPALESFRRVEAEVFYLAGRHDHMSPWSIAVALAAWFPHYRYFIAEDTHTMNEHPECYRQLRNAFFLHGLGSRELDEAAASPLCVEWSPPGK
jgi:pimeloyl-ACP methyl ester carboxylesterase